MIQTHFGCAIIKIISNGLPIPEEKSGVLGLSAQFRGETGKDISP
jgi:hypothetical protein